MAEPKLAVADVDSWPFAGESGAALRALRNWRDRLSDYAVDHPAEALFWVLTGGALVFYLAEKDANEEVASYGDALHYVSTCLSVGYARIFPVTATGKLVATLVMAIGPSLTSWIIEGRLVARQVAPSASPPSPADHAVLRAVVERLDAILARMPAQPPEAR